jgi:hypothetical protein
MDRQHKGKIWHSGKLKMGIRKKGNLSMRGKGMPLNAERGKEKSIRIGN